MRQYRLDTHEEVDGILEYFTTPDVAPGAIAKISRDTGIPESTLSDLAQLQHAGRELILSFQVNPQARALNSEGQAAIDRLSARDPHPKWNLGDSDAARVPLP
jgi:hypothetical protein